MDTSLNPLQPANGWLPPGTAPTNGTVVLVWRRNAQRPCLGCINENGDWSFKEDWGSHIGGAIYWQPLPGGPFPLDAEALAALRLLYRKGYTANQITTALERL